MSPAILNQKMSACEHRWGSEWGGGEISLEEKSNAARKLDYAIQSIPQRSVKVLEIGSGQGRFLRSVRKYRTDLQMYGCDLDFRNLAKGSGLRTEGFFFVGGDIQKLPFKSDSLDHVLFFDVLEHVQDPRESVKECFRILKPGGKLHAFVPCEANSGTLHGLLWRLKVLPLIKSKQAGHIQHFTTGEVLDLFSEAGFGIQTCHHSGYFFEQFFDLLFFAVLNIPILHTSVSKAHTEPVVFQEKDGDGFGRLGIRVLKALKALMFLFGFYESKIFSRFPNCLGVHITVQKPGA